MAILITGVAGFIGSHVCDILLKQNHTIVGVDNFNTYYNPTIKHRNIESAKHHQNFHLIEGSILDISILEHIFQTFSIDKVIHLAAWAGVSPSIKNPDIYYTTNINGTKNILDIATKYNCKKLLFASSSSVYGNNKKTPFSEKDFVDHPISPYAATKKIGEIMCYNYHHLYNIQIACLRFFTVYGPRQRPDMAIHKFFSMISNNEPIPVYNYGKCLRDYTYIDDIVQGILHIINAVDIPFDIINLGESKTISTLELIQLIETTLGKKAQLNLLENQKGDVFQTYADISHAKETYKYTPKHTLQYGIQEFKKWFEERDQFSYLE